MSEPTRDEIIEGIAKGFKSFLEDRQFSQWSEKPLTMMKVALKEELEGPDALKRVAIRAELDTVWLIGVIDQMHDILCPESVGTWQQRAEQVLRVVRRQVPSEVERLEGPIERRMSGEICVGGVRTESYLRDRMGRNCTITVENGVLRS